MRLRRQDDGGCVGRKMGREPERERGHRESGKKERETWGSAWHSWTPPGHRRKQEVAGVWPRAPAMRSSSSWREEEDDWHEPVDWAEPGGLVGCDR